jgi:ERCC4-type nuclease
VGLLVILIDDRIGSRELHPYIQRLGIPCELTRLEYADVCFEGCGRDGTVAVGVERKTLHDMLACIEDARYVAHQLPGMSMLYSQSFLCLEGMWKAGDGGGYQGLLMEGFKGGASWGPLRTKGNRGVNYSKLYRYLLSVQMSGVIITLSRDLFQSAYNICEMYQWFQKPWHSHTALHQTQKLAISDMRGKPSLAKRWAADLDDVGVIYSLEAEQHFDTARALANADWPDWADLIGPGGKRLGVTAAQSIVKSINSRTK